MPRFASLGRWGTRHFTTVVMDSIQKCCYGVTIHSLTHQRCMETRDVWGPCSRQLGVGRVICSLLLSDTAGRKHWPARLVFIWSRIIRCHLTRNNTERVKHDSGFIYQRSEAGNGTLLQDHVVKWGGWGGLTECCECWHCPRVHTQTTWVGHQHQHTHINGGKPNKWNKLYYYPYMTLAKVKSRWSQIWYQWRVPQKALLLISTGK